MAPTHLDRGASRVEDEVVQDLTSVVGSNVEAILEILAEVPLGVTDHAVRSIAENCLALTVKSRGFDEG